MRALMLVLLVGCGSPRRGLPVAGPIALDPQEEHGRAVFFAHCEPCHPGGEGGLGPALNNKPLPDFAIAAQVRRGLGAMPAFPEERISERELDDVIAYMEALRGHE